SRILPRLHFRKVNAESTLALFENKDRILVCSLETNWSTQLLSPQVKSQWAREARDEGTTHGLFGEGLIDLSSDNTHVVLAYYAYISEITQSYVIFLWNIKS